MKDHSRRHEQAVYMYDPDVYSSSSLHSRHVGAEQPSTREPPRQQYHQSRSHHLGTDMSHLGHEVNSNKKQKHKRERGVRFNQ